MYTVSITYPGLPVILPSARRLIRDILAASPRVGDIELIAAELMTNAIQHTTAGEPGGVFTLTIHTGSNWASIEVTDAGGASWQREPDSNVDAEYGRGLMIIAELADRFGHDDDAYGRTVWAEVSW
jgi:anti-sigma regulatory factor (Ser/Thr protein kinase)